MSGEAWPESLPALPPPATPVRRRVIRRVASSLVKLAAGQQWPAALFCGGAAVVNKDTTPAPGVAPEDASAARAALNLLDIGRADLAAAILGGPGRGAALRPALACLRAGGADMAAAMLRPMLAVPA